MSLQLQALRERIATAQNLLGVVQTMRGLAMVNIRRAEAAAEEGKHYARAVHLALHVALRQLHGGVQRHDGDAGRRTGKDDEAPLTAVLLTSDQGLCGQFNERICAYALAWVRREVGPSSRKRVATNRRWIVVGMRGYERLETAGEHIVAHLEAPGSVEAIPGAVNRAFLSLDDVLARGTSRIVLFHNRPDARSSFVERHLQLMPFDPARWAELPPGEPPWRTPPMASLPPEQLLAHLVREQVYIDLYHAFTQSFAAENAARLASMQHAAENIEEHLAELQGRYRRERQDAITTELMEIMGGVEAVQADAP